MEHHEEAETIVVRHDGNSDGGKPTWLEGKPVPDPLRTRDWNAD
ncbi:hypothetical protein [Streptomyces colonosanans]|nr:hypothetical protein [Streptomyces colonosanans]